MTKHASRRDRLELVDIVSADDIVGVEGDADEIADAGDEPLETFDAFYLREFPRLVVLARALAGRSHGPDIAQDAMLVAYRRWDEVRGFTSPAGWVRSVCSNKAISLVRRKETEQRALSRLRLRRPQLVAATDSHIDSELFWQAVRRLPRRQAQAAALYYALDLSLTDIAITLQCAEGTVKVHLSRARAALAEQLAPTQEDRS